ncbi:MAG: hypothetical protein KF814_17175 [Nitrospiraceae bacterium]|nr:hypothetical protein [Nitrospiraceae bacterium]
MWSTKIILASIATGFLLAPYVQAAESSEVEMWECSGPDGTTLYTNKERPGCQPKSLKALSIVPSPPDFPLIPLVSGHPTPQLPRPDWYSYDTPIGALRNMRQVPDWSRDWYASNAQGGPVQVEVCSMYMEWLNLNQKTRGGMFYGTDPSYGGDPSTRHSRTPGNSFADNARYQALNHIFGAGFVPIGCQ